jgi:uncharacterized protein
MKLLKKYLILIAILAIIAVSFFPIKHFIKEKFLINSDNPNKEVVIKGKKYKLEEVNTPETMARGLGGRKSLCDQCGMLFVFPETGKHSFWMKDMKFSLDILWIYGNDIVFIEKNIPADSLEIINPDVISDKVVELAGGTVDEQGIIPGVSLIFSEK